MAKLLIDIDVNGAVKVKNLDKSLDNLERSSKKVDRQNRSTALSMSTLAVSITATAATVYTYTKAIRETLSAGFEYAKQMEDSKAGLQALSLAIQDKNIPITERMTKANREAIVVMAELQKINAKTPHTLDQTNQIYKAMYVSMKNVGASSQDIVDLTQKLSVAAGAAGIEFNGLLAGVDGLASGTVMANSDLGRFLGSLGLTNSELKNSTDVVKLLNETLADFKAIDTITTATSNLKNEWGRLADSMTKDLFVGVKDGMNEMSSIMKTMSSEDTARLRESFNGLAIGISTAMLGIARSVVFVADGFESLGARIAGAMFRIEHGIFLTDEQSAALDRMYASTKADIEIREDFIKGLEKSINVLQKSIKVSSKKTKEVIDQSESYDLLNEKIEDNAGAIGQATSAELEKIYADELLALGLDAQGDELEDVNDKLKEAYALYGVASGAAEGYADSIDNITDALKGNQAAASYTTVTRLDTPQDYADYGFDLPSDYYTNSEYDQYNTVRGYASGGYTGNIPTNRVAGVTHGKEYVVNAETTEDLGLNGQGGLFRDMNEKLSMLETLPKLVETMTKMLYMQKQQYIQTAS